MKHSFLRIHRGTGGIAALVCRGVPNPNPRGAFALLPATALAWAFACTPAAGQALPVQERPALVDGAGRGVAKPACPSLVDGQGARVRSRGTGGAAEASFPRDCPGVAPAPTPALKPPPSPVHHAPVPSLSVPRLAAGTVDADLPDAGDPRDPPPLLVRATPERLSATVLTGGTTLWLLQSGFWTYLLILGLPLWRHVDLLPIVDSAGGRAAGSPSAADPDDERAVARVLIGRGWSRRGRR
jgi:hypothetical protein